MDHRLYPVYPLARHDSGCVNAPQPSQPLSSLMPPQFPMMVTSWSSPPLYSNQVLLSSVTPTNVPRKTRRRLSASESKILNAAFEKHPHPPADVRAKLEKQLSMSRRAVQIWFQNKRAKTRRLVKGDPKAEGLFASSSSLLVYSPLTASAVPTPPDSPQSCVEPDSHFIDMLNTTLNDDGFLQSLRRDTGSLDSFFL